VFGGWKVTLGLIIGLLFILGIGFTYFTYTQNKIDDLIKINSKLGSALEGVNQYNSELKATLEIQNDLISTLNDDLIESSDKINDLREIYRNHDFTNLSREKPGLIENRVNDATKKIFDEFRSD
jgi:hypothetical protein